LHYIRPPEEEEEDEEGSPSFPSCQINSSKQQSFGGIDVGWRNSSIQATNEHPNKTTNNKHE
jgi:hypothetical protein